MIDPGSLPLRLRRAGARFRPAALALLACLAAPAPLKAYVNDALSFAYEAAQNAVEKDGYVVRRETWTGTAASDKPNAIRHHLTKGNSYWFWLGTDHENAELIIRIYDSNGRAVETQTRRFKNAVAARIEVPRTGAYVIAFRIRTRDGSEADWGLAYGYK
ncbi:MAG TPA: hypothetical protein VMN36_03655 [Verrucomicrobiales bacterium]|nr:hypothetical protein [Verrucomicrobiales bacterium]